MSELPENCELWSSVGGELIWESALCRVVRIADAEYPGFCRVILQRHVREMSDLPEDERNQLMHVVFAVEAVLRKLLNPDKINLASLGNMTPHIHWHVIPRWRNDQCFPNPIWAEPCRRSDVSGVFIESCRLQEELVTLLGKPTTTSWERLS